MRFVLRFADEVSAEQRKAAYTHWLLSKGFQDLARGVRQMLEEAFFYNGMVARAGELRTWAELQAAEQELRKEANEMWFSDLLAAVNKRRTMSEQTSAPPTRPNAVAFRDRNCCPLHQSVLAVPDLRNDGRLCETWASRSHLTVCPVGAMRAEAEVVAVRLSSADRAMSRTGRASLALGHDASSPIREIAN